MKKKKILIDLERLRYPNSGIANVFRNLAKGLETLNTDLKISLYGPKEYIKSFITKLHIVKRRFWHKNFDAFGYYDIIHTSHQLSSYFNRNYRRAKKIVTLHDLNFLHENLSDFKREKMLKKVNRNLKYADYIVCISNFIKEDFLKNKHLFNLKKLKDITVIYNGISLPENRKYHLGKYEFLKNKKYILNIGVLFNKKNQLPLIEMLPYLDEDLVLLASGEKSSYADEVRKRISELNLENRVHILKDLSEEEKYAVIQNSEAMCHPSIAEGFGIPPVEAMAFGKPVFLSRFTSLPEIGGDAAFYFNDFEPEKMANLFKEKMSFYHKNTEKIMQKIIAHSQQFNYTKMAENYLKFYEKVLE